MNLDRLLFEDAFSLFPDLDEGVDGLADVARDTGSVLHPGDRRPLRSLRARKQHKPGLVKDLLPLEASDHPSDRDPSLEVGVDD